MYACEYLIDLKEINISVAIKLWSSEAQKPLDNKCQLHNSNESNMSECLTFNTWKHNSHKDLDILFWSVKTVRTVKVFYYITIYNCPHFYIIKQPSLINM